MAVEYLKSEKVAFRHGFFTRQGGVSKKPFDSLNATTRVGDSEENVATNRKRALKELQLKAENLAFLDELIHDDKILAVTEAAKGLDFNGYDAIMTNQAGIALGICVADCPIVLLASETDGVIGLVHAGWRGTHADLVLKTVEAMQEEYAVDPSNLAAVVGPGILVNHYEVGEEVAKLFNPRYVVAKDSSYHLDFRLAIVDQLVEAGIREIDDMAIDTFSDQRFFSYRRDHGETGRNFVIVSM